MKNFLRLLSVILLFSITMTGCYYDKEDVLYPAENCDTVLVTYTLSIAPIMTANCNVCHSTALATANVITDNYDSLFIVAQNGRLWAAVNHTGTFKMPKDQPKLPVCDLAKIKKWIDTLFPIN
jgi:hypothetical protein